MATQPSPVSASRYKIFRSLPSCPKDMDGFGRMVDDDGTIFYETENGELLLEIIRLNDVGVLARYLETNTALGPRDVQMDDPFWNAVVYGSTNVLCALLQHWDATQPSIGTDMPAPDRRGFGLLQTACEFSHIETVRFLLNGPWSSAAPGRSWGLFGPGFLPSRSMTGKQDSHGSMRSHFAHAEEVMQLLLDRGARVGDGIITRDGLQETVLSRAITGASSALVKRLIDQGADAYAKTTYDFFDGSLYGGFGSDTIIRDVTPLHMGSLYFNTGGVQVLLNHARATGVVDMVKHPDSHGRLRLHWAAWGLNESDELYGLKADEIVPHVTATIELLVAAAPSTVNAQDDRGDTPLHYAVRRHARCGDRHVAILRTLCEHGADAGLGGRNGETPLHGLGFRFRDGEPIESILIDLLLEHGASVGDADDDGNTPLHFAAKHLAHVEAAQHLLSRGADVSVQNSQGNTPLHEAALGFYSGPLGGSQPRERKLTLESRVRAQDEMMRILLHHFSETKANALMNQTNADYETPRQICQERRRKWRDEEITHKPLAMGRGRRRG